MRKISLGFLLLMGGALLGAQTTARSAAQTAVIRELSGRVETKAPGAVEWKAAEPGQVLDREAFISTGFKSTALITIGNSNITVRPLTRLRVEEIARGGEQVVLDLRAGRIRADVKPPVEGTISFSVKSPMATASVRGTIFDFDGTRLKVEEGRVHLGGQRLTGAYVGKGHVTVADPETGSATPVIESLKAELSPPLPAAVEAVPAVSAPANAGLGIWFEWPQE